MQDRQKVKHPFSVYDFEVINEENTNEYVCRIHEDILLEVYDFGTNRANFEKTTYNPSDETFDTSDMEELEKVNFHYYFLKQFFPLAYELYKISITIVKASPKLQKKYNLFTPYQETSPDGKILSENTLHGILLFKIALDSLSPHEIYDYYQASVQTLEKNIPFRLPNNSQFLSPKALHCIIRGYISHRLDQYSFLPEEARQLITPLSASELESLVMKNAEPAFSCIIQGKTRVQMFIELAKTNPEKACELAQDIKVREIFAKKMTLDQLTEVIGINEAVGVALLIDSPVSQLIFEPNHLVSLMKTNPAVANVLIANNIRIFEMMHAQGLPEELPEFEHYSFKYKKEWHLTFLTQSGLHDSSEYCDAVLIALAHIIFKRVKQFDLKSLLSPAGIMICREIGRLQIDSLHGIPIEPSHALVESILKLLDLQHMRLMNCTSTLFGINMEKYIETQREAMKKNIPSYFDFTSESSHFGQQMFELYQHLYEVCQELATPESRERLELINFTPSNPYEALPIILTELNQLNESWRSPQPLEVTTDGAKPIRQRLGS